MKNQVYHSKTSSMRQPVVIIMVLLSLLPSCYPDESLDVDERDIDLELNLLDEYINENFTEEYNMAIRYRFVDRYVNPGERVTPPK
ncbi:MAG: putative zinc-binding metallopeptidase, partial [Marinoscillum sp.]